MSMSYPPRRFASPPRGATPEARQSRFLGVSGRMHFVWHDDCSGDMDNVESHL